MGQGRAILLGGFGMSLIVALLTSILVASPTPPTAAAGGGGGGPEPPLCFAPAACPNLVVRSVRVLLPPEDIRAQPRTSFEVELVNIGTATAKATNTALRVNISDRQIAFADRWTREIEPGERRVITLTVQGRFDEAIQCAFLVADSRFWVDESDENNLLTIGSCG